jgi:hypothetical protein
MQMDLNKYRVNAKFVQDFYQRNKDYYESIGKLISVCSGVTHCPYVALAFYLSESIGFIPEMVQTIDSQIKYYGYTEILGQSANSPYLSSYGEMV